MKAWECIIILKKSQMIQVRDFGEKRMAEFEDGGWFSFSLEALDD